MNDKDLDALFSELSGRYQAEFDVPQGIAELRAAGHGFRATSGHDAGEGDRAAAHVPRSPRRLRSAAGGADVPDDVQVAQAFATFQQLIDRDVVRIDLTKLEGEPTGKAETFFLQVDPVGGAAAKVSFKAYRERPSRREGRSVLATLALLGTLVTALVAMIVLIGPASGLIAFALSTLGFASGYLWPRREPNSYYGWIREVWRSFTPSTRTEEDKG